MEEWPFSHLLYFLQLASLKDLEQFLLYAKLHGAKDVELPDYSELEIMFDEQDPLESDPWYQEWQETVRKSKKRRQRSPEELKQMFEAARQK